MSNIWDYKIYSNLYHTLSFEELIRLALQASKVLHTEMRNAVRSRTGELVQAMGGAGISRIAGREAAPGGLEIDDGMGEE